MNANPADDRRHQKADVPCGTCSACCWHDRVILGPADNPHDFSWHDEDGYAVLDRKPDGSCIYLNDKGCSIHGSAPMICQRMDCRVLYLETPSWVKLQRQERNPHMANIYAAAFERIHTLKE